MLCLIRQSTFLYVRTSFKSLLRHRTKMEQCQLHGFIDTILPNASYVMVSSLHVFDSMIKAATPCKRTMSIYMVSIKVSMTQFHLMLVMYYRYMCLII